MKTMERDYFHVFKSGPLTIIGFTAVHATKPENIEVCRRQLQEIVDENTCQELVVDLYELPVVSSWILGLLAWVQGSGLNVSLYHPSTAIREVLNVTKMDGRMEVREGFAELAD